MIVGPGWRAAVVLFTGILQATAATGQTALRLPGPSAVLDHEFTRISGVRELPDGRVLVSDGRERTLWVGDWRTGGTTPIGRQGRGPGEYLNAADVLAIAGDSTLLVDNGGGRYLLLQGDSIVETVSANSPPLRAGARNPFGADRLGHLLFSRPMARSAPGPSGLPFRTDSLHLLRVARASGVVDTLAGMRARPSTIRIEGPVSRPTSVEVASNPLAAGDLAAMFNDGWIAVARVVPYRVDWISPDGRLRLGPPLPFAGGIVTEADKRDVMRRIAAERGENPSDPSAFPNWPERMSPFLPGALQASAAGDLWIRRTPTAGRPETVYDVITRRGVTSGRLTLRENAQVAAIGRDAIYVIVTDDDGIQRLRRHPLPR